jgi:hypothetical protein
MLNFFFGSSTCYIGEETIEISFAHREVSMHIIYLAQHSQRFQFSFAYKAALF